MTCTARSIAAAALALAVPIVAGCLADRPVAESPPSSALPMPSPTPPRTIPELSNFRRTCSHAELMAYLDAVDRAHDPRIVRTSFGLTPEGRELPLLIVADPPVHDGHEARATGKPRVLVMANIHAGEVEGKEACLELLRDIAWPAAGAPEAGPFPVGDIVLLVAPIYNADGNDRFGPKNRPLQQGPAECGQRPNAAGLDLNRDYLKLEAPETRALVALLGDFDPHVVVDLHTTNGSAHGYELTYAGPLTPSAHPALAAMVNDDWLPTLRRRVREHAGFELFDYGNFLRPDGDEKDEPDAVTGWRTFDHRPRFGNNYVGLRNRVAILSEAYSYADFPTRIAATKAFVTEILRLAAERAEQLTTLCRELDAATAGEGARGELLQATGAELVERGVEPVLLRGFRLVPDPATGEIERVADGPRTTQQLPCFVTFAGTGIVPAPRAYLVPPGRGEFDPAGVLQTLRRHGLRTETLTEPLTAEVEVATVQQTATAAEDYQAHHARHVDWTFALARRTFPPGTVRIGLDQPLARLAFQLLDPRADDGLIVWDAFDAVLGAGPGAELPVYALR